MNGDRTTPPADEGSDGPTHGDRSPGTGEGASTALEALIRKRKLAEAPDAAGEPEPPAKP